MSNLLRRANAVLDLHQVGGCGPYLPLVVSAAGRKKQTREVVELYRRLVDERDPLKQFALDQELGDMLGFPVWERTLLDDTTGFECVGPPAKGGLD